MRCRSFILMVVKYTWVRRLQYPDSFYTRFAPRDLLDLLAMHSGGLERADVVSMFATMHLWWAEDPCVPKFINMFDGAQKKATSSYLPITDNWLTAMATFALLSANSFPNDRPSWDVLVPSTHTWTAWKLKFLPSP